MAYKPSNNEGMITKTKLDDAIAADSYNLTPDFFEKTKPIFEKINNSVNAIVKSYGFNNNNNYDITNPLKGYNKILYNTIDTKNVHKEILETKSSNLESGIRSISAENQGNNIEEGIINSFQKITSESFALMEEYRTACSLIPELKRVIKLIVRDIVNANEISKRSIHDVYSLKEEDVDETTDDAMEINKIIDDEITDRYKIEEKLQIWIYEALISGAKPILVLPYKDIIKQALALSSTQNKDGSYKEQTSDSAKAMQMSMEAMEGLPYEEFEQKGLEALDPFKLNKLLNSDAVKSKTNISPVKKYKDQSQEELDAYNDAVNEFVSDIIDDDIVNQIYNNGMEELYKTYMYEKSLADMELETSNKYGLESDDKEKIYETVNSIKSFIEKIENGEETEEDKEEKTENEKRANEMHIKESIKKNLANFVCQIDKNINIIDDDYSSLSLSKNNLINKMTKKKTNDKLYVDGIYVKNKKTLDSLTEDYDGEVLITELNPENVIPISVGSQHIQYYIYEVDAYNGAQQSSSRKTTSFANIIAATGYGNDKAVVSASNGVSLIPNDPSLSSVFNPANFGNINLPINNSDLMNTEGQTDVLKQIVFKTLSKRMSDPSLCENKAFTDAIMNLIRQGYIINREVKFTCVPATNVVYFAHDIDDKGLPHSILDGTLLQIYMYLAGIVSTTMSIVNKSSDKEKLEVNMGMSHQTGMSLMEIQKQLSSRNIHVKSFFNNIGSVLRNVATFSRYAIPIVEGEKLYDVSTVEKNNESPIDTDFVESRLTSILSSLPAPPAILNMMQEAEFSRSIVNQNLEYKNSISEKQVSFGKCVTKLYRLIAIYTNLSREKIGECKENESHATTDKDKKDKERTINISNMDVKFSSPMYLNMVNISESFNNAEPVIEQFSKYFFGEDQDTELEKLMVRKYKIECIKRFANNIDFSDMEEIANNIKSNPLDGIVPETKNKIVGKKTNEFLTGEDQGDDGDDGF
ncbi:MAG: hypothetical protein ACRC5M_04500 [Anaeroplasmataceae bacterium]